MNAKDILDQRDEQYRGALNEIGAAIGYGRAQQILGQLWDAMLYAEYGLSLTRGAMGITVDDALPSIPKPARLRRQLQPYGGYAMVPAYSVEELKAFAHAAISQARMDAMEECAKRCEAHGTGGFSYAAAIRALAMKEAP